MILDFAVKNEVRGGVLAVAVKRKRVNGKTATYTQWRLQWEESRANGKPYKATRYLRQAIVAAVKADWERGLTAREICQKYNLEKPKTGKF